jgi:hypothetical protein
VTELIVDQDTVLTQLAKDTASKVGVTLVHDPATASKGSHEPKGQPALQTTRSGGLKPRGCQHGPLAGSGTVSSSRASSDSTVAELIGLVRQIADKERGA